MLLVLTACTPYSKKLHVRDISMSFEPDTIISSKSGVPVTFEVLMGDVNGVRLLYVGEQHTNPGHHAVQLKILESLYSEKPNLIVGMEMFDQTYQPVLDLWSGGSLTTQEFIEKVHWYANWKYDFELYRGILTFIKDHQIPLIALNIPSDIPPKIAVGGLDNLRPWEKVFIPELLDTSNTAHKSYIETIYNMHHIKGRDNFEYFYAAQCVWEDGMAERIADHIGENPMVVFAGNGHIVRKFGIPNRAYDRTGHSFRTVMPVNTGSETDLSDADYLWVTAP
jgi:uncharacterized iron-regulated protein